MTKLEALQIQQRIDLRLFQVNQALDIATLEDKDMAVSPEVAALITKFDTATDNIAARIAKLIATSQTLSAEDQAALQGEVDKLNSLGQDPNNPVPPAAAVV